MGLRFPVGTRVNVSFSCGSARRDLVELVFLPGVIDVETTATSSEEGIGLSEVSSLERGSFLRWMVATGCRLT